MKGQLSVVGGALGTKDHGQRTANNAFMYEDLQIVVYPDPRLRKAAAPVEAFDASLKELAGRMLELMRQHKGVGLAAPQVGLPIRLFVMNPTPDQPLKDDRVFVNPQLSEAE